MLEHGLVLFHIPGIPDFISNTWIVMLILIFIASKLSKKLDLFPKGKFLLSLELMAKFIKDLMEQTIGKEKTKKLFPFFFALFIFILALNLWGLIPGAVQPTSNVNTTLALALCAFVLYHALGIKYQGIVNYIKHFLSGPKWLVPLMLPVEIVSHLARIISLSFRLFGNMFGDEMLVLVLMMILPIGLPLLGIGIVFGNSFLQAFIFFILSLIYVALAVHHEDHDKKKENNLPNIDLA
ncbi:MAG TPA: ATP synthase F0 subunit A [Desulfurobacteriaceae bacterium]|nr:ATP synthase F0 subunit A [Desulfurobacteriaceae bacterium]